MSRLTRVLIVVATMLVGVVVGYFVSTWISDSAPTPQYARPAIGGPYTLTNHRGETVTDQTYRGKVQLVFFGFTHCPDVCPTALSLLTDLLEQLGPSAEQVQPIFITVDPERDTVEAMSRYVEAFHPSIIGLTGSLEQVATAAQAFRVYYRKAPVAGGDYFMEHSGSIYVMDRSGAFRGTLDLHEDPKVGLEKLRKLLGTGLAS